MPPRGYQQESSRGLAAAFAPYQAKELRFCVTKLAWAESNGGLPVLPWEIVCPGVLFRWLGTGMEKLLLTVQGVETGR